MYLFSLLPCVILGVFASCAAEGDWCYTSCDYTPTHWKELSGSSCGNMNQSPIDIETKFVKIDENLKNFTFANFTSNVTIKSVTNTGDTVKYKLHENTVTLSGGGLTGTYSTIQFHFHWGYTAYHPGSEHTIDGYRYPMEMHIVSLKKDLSPEQAMGQADGIAVLGFFINATEDGNMSGPWDMLTSCLPNERGAEIVINDAFSIMDLIGNVDLTKFFRYNGSLTTPNCSEAVIWTVFQEPIKVHKNLIQRFPMETKLINIYRPTQELNKRQVFASPAVTLPSRSWCYDEDCDYSQFQWHLLPRSQCNGKRQSPINIETKNVLVDARFDAFTFTKFDDKHVIDQIVNTGHSVKGKLKEGMVEVSGGDLKHVYSTLQFHFHWSSASQNSEGSEHTVNSRRYPMEMHIVSKRKDLTLEEALNTPDGLAVLAFFIEATDMIESSSSVGGSGSRSDSHEINPTSDMGAWKTLTNYLSAIPNISSEVEVKEEISIDDLLGNVNRAAYYRYNGSLTTPSCQEVVVWTIFKESIKVDKNLMKMFPTWAGYRDVFRRAQPLYDRTVYSTIANASASSAPVPIVLFVLLTCLWAFLL